jgi:KTSC domain
MLRNPVSSSVIASIGYDDDRKVLEVKLLSGNIYRYHRVGRDVFEDFCDAPSKGEYFNAHIRDAYLWDQVK